MQTNEEKKPYDAVGTAFIVKGPWEVSVDEESARITIVAPWSDRVRPANTATFGDYRGAHICHIDYVSATGSVPSKEQAMAHAKLIASIPLFLEKLQDAANALSNAQGEWSSVDAAYAPEWTHELKDVESEILTVIVDSFWRS